MGKKINPNFRELVRSFKKKRGVVLEGSSRSGKTWSGIDFIIFLCSRVESGATINIVKETYNSFKTTLYEDFNRRLPMFGINSPFMDVQEVPGFKLFGNKINLLGADKPSKFLGAGSDYLFFNEANHIDQKIFDQAEQRCRKFWWMDYNPEHPEHWIYDRVCKRSDVSHITTTYVDNPFISTGEKSKIEGYEPLPDDYKYLKNLPKAEVKNEINKLNMPGLYRPWRNENEGTANLYNWKVYGLGERAAREGVIFPRWKRGHFPDNIDYGFGIDWGVNDPFAFIKVAVDPKRRIIYVKECSYETDLSTTAIHRRVAANCSKSDLIVCDNEQKISIADLREKDYNAIPAFKPAVSESITWMMDYLIMVDGSPNVENELNNYIWADKKSETPIDGFNHAIDAIRYYFIWWYRNVRARG